MKIDKTSWMTYILRCSDDTFYCGITKDLPSRIEKHNEGIGAKYTRSRRPVTLEWSEPQPDHSLALRREIEIKKMTRAQKKLLIEGEKNVKS
jgi:putative endonuclease